MIGQSDLQVVMKLDQGGNGTVHLATNALGQSYAVKVIVGLEKKTLAWREFVFGHNLHHLNLGRCLAFTDNQVYPTENGGATLAACLVLEYIAGSNLLKHVVMKPFSERVGRFLFSYLSDDQSEKRPLATIKI